jgi:hypothetical protein
VPPNKGTRWVVRHGFPSRGFPACRPLRMTSISCVNSVPNVSGIWGSYYWRLMAPGFCGCIHLVSHSPRSHRLG